MTADKLLHKFDVFRNSDVRTDLLNVLARPPAEIIFFSNQSTRVLAKFFPENFLRKVLNSSVLL